MIHSLNFPLSKASLEAYGGIEKFSQSLKNLGFKGIEGIWSGEPIADEFYSGIVSGYHLTFFTDWLDFIREDWARVAAKFGSRERAFEFFGGGPEFLMQSYKEDLKRAVSLGVPYTVFHVSDVSLEESYTYNWLHTDEEIVKAAVDVVNELTKDLKGGPEFLVENQWCAGFRFTDPKITALLLDGIRYPKKGIMLDTGHLMNCNWALRTQWDGIKYIEAMVDAHEDYAGYIRGLHFSQSISGAFAEKNAGRLPADYPEDYLERFKMNYGFIRRIDRHEPWTEPSVAGLIEEINPKYVTHELAYSSPETHLEAAALQMKTLKKGGLKFE